jgi:hypothetical protein
MWKRDAPGPPPDVSSSRRRLLVLTLIGCLAAAVFAVARVVEDGPETNIQSSTSTTADNAATRTTLEETKIVSRLRDVLSVRDRAYRERDPDVLESVYTTDCPCLKGDQGAIRQLLKDNAVWVGATTSIRIRKVEKVNDRLWVVLAIFDGSPFRIETESGQLIRAVQGRSELFRFVLAKPARDARILLGFAAPVSGTD